MQLHVVVARCKYADTGHKCMCLFFISVVGSLDALKLAEPCWRAVYMLLVRINRGSAAGGSEDLCFMASRNRNPFHP